LGSQEEVVYDEKLRFNRVTTVTLPNGCTLSNSKRDLNEVLECHSFVKVEKPCFNAYRSTNQNVTGTFKLNSFLMTFLTRQSPDSHSPTVQKDLRVRTSSPILQVSTESEYSDPEWQSDSEQSSEPDAPLCPEYRTLILSNVMSQEMFFDSSPARRRLKHSHRSKIVSWLLRVSSEMRFQDETVFVAVALFDRVTAAEALVNGKFQLFAATCLWIASKMEEKLTASVSDFVYLCGRVHSGLEFVQCEDQILQLLHFDVALTVPVFYVEALLPPQSEADDVAFFFCQAILYCQSYSAANPSAVGLAAIFLAVLLTEVAPVKVERAADAVQITECTQQMIDALEEIGEDVDNPLHHQLPTRIGESPRETAQELRPHLTEANVARVFHLQ
jgi:hypothetical protein